MANTACDLGAKTCKPCEGGVPPLEQTEIDRLLLEQRFDRLDGSRSMGVDSRERNHPLLRTSERLED